MGGKQNGDEKTAVFSGIEPPGHDAAGKGDVMGAVGPA